MSREELQKVFEKARELWPSKRDYRVSVDTNDYDGGDSLDVSISMKADEVSLPSIMELADFVGKKPEETFLNANEDNLEIRWDFDHEEGEGEWKPDEHFYGTLGEDMGKPVKAPDDGNMEKGLEKVQEDYKGALQMIDDYDHGRLTGEQLYAIRQEQKRILDLSVGNGNISRKIFWEKARLKALKYDMADTQEMEFQQVPVPKEITGRLEELRDSKELPVSIWALFSGIIEAFAEEFKR